MSYQDLPRDWPMIPLTDDTHTADVLDLFVSLEARYAGALMILVCDEQLRPLQLFQIDGVTGCPAAQDLPGISRIAETIGSEPGVSVVCAVARRGKLSQTANDGAWLRAIETAFAGHAPVLGFYVATPAGLLKVHRSVQAA